MKRRSVHPMLWEFLSGLLVWRNFDEWGSDKATRILGYSVPAVDEPVREGMFQICFRGHPFVDPFEASQDGIAHASPFFRVALDYCNDNYGTLPEGFGFLTAFETVPGQEFGQDWTLRKERPDVGLIHGKLDAIKHRTVAYRPIKAGDLYETGVERGKNPRVALFAVDQEQRRMARIGLMAEVTLRALALCRHPNYEYEVPDRPS